MRTHTHTHTHTHTEVESLIDQPAFNNPPLFTCVHVDLSLRDAVTCLSPLQVDMETHAGYMGGLQRTFCKDCTLPYYSTSSEEILFHVSTRMPSKGTDIEQKVSELVCMV